MNISPLKKQSTPNKQKTSNQSTVSTQNLTQRTPDRNKNTQTNQSTNQKNSPKAQYLAQSNQVLVQHVNQLEQKIKNLSNRNLLLEQEILEIQAKNIALREELAELNKDSARIQQYQEFYFKNQEEIQQLHSLLCEKNSKLIQWTNKYNVLEKKYDTEIKFLQKLGDERNSKQKFIDIINEYEQKIKHYEQNEQEIQDAFKQSSRQMKSHLNQLYQENEKLSFQLEETKKLLFNAQIEKIENEKKIQVIPNNLSKSLPPNTIEQIKQSQLPKEFGADEVYRLKSQVSHTQYSAQKETQFTQERQQRSQSTHESLEIQTIKREFLKYYNLLIQTQQKLDLSIKTQAELQQNMLQLQQNEQEKQIKIEELENLLQQKKGLQSRLTDTELKLAQIEAEKFILIKQISEKQEELDDWVKRVEKIQQEYSRNIEELNKQFDEFRKTQSENQYLENQKMLENRLKIQKQQLEIAQKGVDINEELQEKEQKIEELNCIIEQLQKDNYDLSVNLEQQTDRLLKLQLTIHQASQNQIYESGNNGEFSFQQIRLLGHRNSEITKHNNEESPNLQQLWKMSNNMNSNQKEYSSDQFQNQTQALIHTL